MAFEIRINPQTFLEIDEAIVWYEKQIEGLSKQFLFALDDCIDKISKQPENY